MFVCCIFFIGQTIVLPVQTLLSLPEMVYPGSQVQWVVPWTVLQRDGRTKAPGVAAVEVAAAAADDDEEEEAVEGEEVFVVEVKTERSEETNHDTFVI